MGNIRLNNLILFLPPIIFHRKGKQTVYYLHISNKESCAHLLIPSRLMVELTISKQKAVDTVAKISSSLLPVS